MHLLCLLTFARLLAGLVVALGTQAIVDLAPVEGNGSRRRRIKLAGSHATLGVVTAILVVGEVGALGLGAAGKNARRGKGWG